VPRTAEGQSKGSCWFSGHAQAVAGNVAIKVAAVEEKVFSYELNILDLENRRGNKCPPLAIPIHIQAFERR
jgi:hypothetical protein